MSSRISISNRCLAITHQQFCQAVMEFQSLLEKSYDCACSVEIKAMSRVKLSPSVIHDGGDLDFADKFNQEAVFAQAYCVENFAAKEFADAVYIEAVYRPLHVEKAPKHAFALLEAKGTRPRQVTYYLQPGDDSLIKALAANHRFQILHDGFTGNTY